MQLENLYIQESTEYILQVLKSDLELKGIHRFKDLKQNRKNIQTQCPFHKDGQERKPSFGINDEGCCHCFSCGWAGTIDRMISEIHLKYDNGDYGRKWLMRHFNSTQIENRKIMTFGGRRNARFNTNTSSNMDINRPMRNKEQFEGNQHIIKEEELEKYRYIHPYMYERGLTDEIIEMLDIGYDSVTRCLTFPVLDINGNCVFIARRSVDIKFFNYPAEVEKPVYQAYRFKNGEYKTALDRKSVV